MPLPSEVHAPSALEVDYTIEQRGGKWCLVSKSDGMVLDCYNTKEEAEAQERVVQANSRNSGSRIELTLDEVRSACVPCAEKMGEKNVKSVILDLSRIDMGLDGVTREASQALRDAARRKFFDINESHNIRGVEIFAVGKWNGDFYTVEDLDQIASAFEETKLYLKPYLKIGHGKKQTLLEKDELPAAGFISAVYRKDDKLLADFEHVPKKIFELIRARAYDKVSSEIYVGIKVNGKEYKKVLKAVALLGGETPAVGTLDQIRALYVSDVEAKSHYNSSDTRAYEFAQAQRKEGHMPHKECPEMLEETRQELEELKKKQLSSEAEAKKFCAESASLRERVAALENENSEIKKSFLEASGKLEKVEQERRLSRAEAKVKELVYGKKMLPAQADALKAILLHSMEHGLKKFKLGEREVEGMEALVLEFLEKGDSSGLPTDESSKLGKATKLADKTSKAFAQAVQEHAEANKLSYAEAYKRLVAELDKGPAK